MDNPLEMEVAGGEFLGLPKSKSKKSCDSGVGSPKSHTLEKPTLRVKVSREACTDSGIFDTVLPTSPDASPNKQDFVRLENSEIFVGPLIHQKPFSSIYNGTFKKTSVVVKQKRILPNQGHFEELELWQAFSFNKNIVKLYDFLVIQEDNINFYCIAMEEALYTLQEEIILRKSNFYQNIKYIKSAAEGLGWLHSNGIIHKNIRPSKILIFQDCQGKIAKLSDCGMTNFYYEHCLGNATDLEWQSPEIIQAVSRGAIPSTSTSVDIFSLGMTLWSALSGEFPFENRRNVEEVMEKIMEFQKGKLKLGGIELAATHLAQWMLKTAPENRPDIGQVLNHPTFWDVRKSINFLLDITYTFVTNKEESRIANKAYLDQKYELFAHCIQTDQANFNWKSKAEQIENGQLLLDFFQQKYSYDFKSVTSLLDLLKNVSVHNQEILRACENFDTGKFHKEFLLQFPCLSIFFFTELSKITGKSKMLIDVWALKGIPHLQLKSEAENIGLQATKVSNVMEGLELKPKLDFGDIVVKRKTGLNCSSVQPYNLGNSSTKRYALILNDISVSNRTGDETDQQNLYNLLQNLNYKVQSSTLIFTKTSVQEIINAFKAKLIEQNNEIKSILLSIMAHGYNSVIYSQDGKRLNLYKDIIFQLNDTQLKDKPKIFIFQACRPLSDNTQVEKDMWELDFMNRFEHLENKYLENTLICYDSPLGFVRSDLMEANLFLYAFCKALAEKETPADVVSLMLKDVPRIFRERAGKQIAMPYIESLKVSQRIYI